MENLFQTTFKIQNQLGKVGIDSAVIGALAVALWGKPRLTQDIDLKVLLSRNESYRLLELLKEDYQFLAENPEQTFRERGFIFLRSSSGVRIDLLGADTPYDIQSIHRAKFFEIEPHLKLKVVSAEDLIIYKLISTRPKDQEDARAVLLRQDKTLDRNYIFDWLTRFELAFDDSTLIQAFKAMEQKISI